MARRGALTALQAALAGVSGGAQGYIQQRELERKRLKEEQDRARQEAMDEEQRKQYRRQEAIDVANLISSGKAVEMQPEPAGLPPSAIPLPRADQVGGRAGIEIGGRRLAIRGGEELGQLTAQQTLAAALQQAEALAPIRMREAAAAAGASTRAAAGARREEASQNRRAAFESLKAMGALTPMDQYNPARKYEDELESQLNIRERQATNPLSLFAPGATPGTSQSSTFSVGNKTYTIPE